MTRRLTVTEVLITVLASSGTTLEGIISDLVKNGHIDLEQGMVEQAVIENNPGKIPSINAWIEKRHGC